MYLDRLNLQLHAICSKETTRISLTGILVDPKRGVTTASNGAMLVEVDMLKDAAGPVPETTGDPILLPAEVARKALKAVRDGAAGIGEQDGKKILFVHARAKTEKFVFDPIESTFPEYDNNETIFPKAKPQAVFEADAALLAGTVRTLGSDEAVSL